MELPQHTHYNVKCSFHKWKFTHFWMLLLCVTFIVGATKAKSNTSPAFKRVCYFTNWSCDLLEKEAHFCLRHIDASLCSHIIYSFVDINVTSLSLTPSRVDDETKDGVEGRYILFNNLKQSHPHLKTLLSVGGSYQSGGFKAVASSVTSRRTFASRSVAYVRRWGFDGLDVDWEYPDEKESLALLLQDLRQSDETQRTTSGEPPLIISVAGPASEELVDQGFQVEEIVRNADFINLMAYDLQGSWSHVTGFNSPLFPRRNDSRFTPEHCVEWVVSMWARKGAPLSKIVLGIAGYGQSYTLERKEMENTTTTPSSSGDILMTASGKRIFEPTSTTTTSTTTKDTTIRIPPKGKALGQREFPSPGSPAAGPGIPGRLRHLEGQLSYPEICEYIDQGGHVTWDGLQRVPYMSYDDLWVGYDDIRSIVEKVTWAHGQGLGGVMFWSLDLDDFTGNYCNQGRYPLLTAMSDSVISLENNVKGNPEMTIIGDDLDLDHVNVDSIPTEFVILHGEVRPVEMRLNHRDNDEPRHSQIQHNEESTKTNNAVKDKITNGFVNTKSRQSQSDSSDQNADNIEEGRTGFDVRDIAMGSTTGQDNSKNGHGNTLDGNNKVNEERSKMRGRSSKRNRTRVERRHNDPIRTRRITPSKERTRERTNRNGNTKRRIQTRTHRHTNTKRIPMHTTSNTRVHHDSKDVTTITTPDDSTLYGRKGHDNDNDNDSKLDIIFQQNLNKLSTTTTKFSPSEATTANSLPYQTRKTNLHRVPQEFGTNTEPTRTTKAATTHVAKYPDVVNRIRKPQTTTLSTPKSNSNQYDLFPIYDDGENDPTSQFDFYYIAFKLPELTKKPSVMASAHSTMSSLGNLKSINAGLRDKKSNRLPDIKMESTESSDTQSSSSSEHVHNLACNIIALFFIYFILITI